MFVFGIDLIDIRCYNLKSNKRVWRNGRRTRLRIWRFTTWRFKSSHPHQMNVKTLLMKDQQGFLLWGPLCMLRKTASGLRCAGRPNPQRTLVRVQLSRSRRRRRTDEGTHESRIMGAVGPARAPCQTPFFYLWVGVRDQVGSVCGLFGRPWRWARRTFGTTSRVTVLRGQHKYFLEKIAFYIVVLI